MATTTDSQRKDLRFASRVERHKKRHAVGILILPVLSFATLIISVVSYVRNHADRPEELAQCIVVGLYIPVLVFATYLGFSIEPNKLGLQKFIFGAIATMVFNLYSVAFALLIGRHVVNGTPGGPEPRLKAAVMITDMLDFVVGFMVFFTTKPLFQALRWCSKSPTMNGPALAYPNDNWELPLRDGRPSERGMNV